MPPNIEDIKDFDQGVEVTSIDDKALVAPQAGPRKYTIVYRNLVTFGYWHAAALYGLYLCFVSAKWQTIVLAFILNLCAEIGITAGAHRLWAHRTYKAKMPLQILLMVFNSIAFQNTAIDWIRDHRLHHKFSDTDADPHNATRGFFYSHVGWLLVRKHPEVKRKGKTIDMTDIYNNPVLKFQKKFCINVLFIRLRPEKRVIFFEYGAHGVIFTSMSRFVAYGFIDFKTQAIIGFRLFVYAIPLMAVICFGLPTLAPMYFWNETLNNAWHVTILRYVLTLNITFLVNSAAHAFGNKPYDINILPAQNKLVSILALGEGFHNYHHVYPGDYRTAELGNNMLNMTTLFIDFFAWIGWAYDLKTVSAGEIEKRSNRTGDGTTA